MKKYKLSKKIFSLLLVFVLAFSTVSVAAVEFDGESDNSVASVHEHIFGDFTVIQKATCKSTGKAQSKCIIEGCNVFEEKTLPISPDSHHFGAGVETKEPTCLEDGYEISICNDCGKEYKVVKPKTGHNFLEEDWIVIVEPIHTPTVIRYGKARNTCANCGVTEFRTIESPHTFSPDNTNAVVTQSATCVSTGTMFKSCLGCNNSISITIEKDPNAHVYGENIHIISNDFSCQKDGTGVQICEKCEHVETVIVPKEDYHKYLDWEIRLELPSSATCENNEYGIMARVCPVENKDVELKYFYADHQFAGNTVGYAATCSAEGYERGYCRVCKLSNQTNVLPINPEKHKWMDAVVLRPATCTETGISLKRCQHNASHSEIIVVEKTEHVFEDEWQITEATCTNDGYKTNTCVDCKAKITLTIPKDPAAHIYDESKKDASKRKAPTCSAEGEEYVYCTECKKYIPRSIDKHSDTLFEIENSREPATCGAEGKIHLQCSVCSTKVTKTIEKDPNSHVPEKKYETIKEPTCHSKGLKAKKCANCKTYIESTKVEIEEIGEHIVGEWVITEGTCTTRGEKVRYCLDYEVNGCDFSETIIIAPSHSYTAWSYASDNATCINPTMRTRFCRKCGVEENEVYYGDHVPGEWKFDKGYSCETGGIVRIYCAVDGCNDVCRIIRNVPANAHVIDADGAYQPLDLEKDKSVDKYCAGRIYDCKVCGNPVRITAEHNFVVLVKDVKATCTESGMTAKKFCSDCLYVKEATVIEPLGHAFEWGDNGTPVCTRCGVYEVGEGVTCDHFCHHKGTIATIMTKIFSFFWKLFGQNHYCPCGAVHYHEESATIISKKVDDNGKITEIKFTCSECRGLSKTKTITF